MFKLEIDIKNDAFQPGPESALHQILIKVAQRVREGATSGRVTDPNGNYVGDFSYVGNVAGDQDFAEMALRTFVSLVKDRRGVVRIWSEQKHPRIHHVLSNHFCAEQPQVEGNRFKVVQGKSAFATGLERQPTMAIHYLGKIVYLTGEPVEEERSSWVASEVMELF